MDLQSKYRHVDYATGSNNLDIYACMCCVEQNATAWVRILKCFCFSLQNSMCVYASRLNGLAVNVVTLEIM